MPTAGAGCEEGAVLLIVEQLSSEVWRSALLNLLINTLGMPPTSKDELHTLLENSSH